MTSSLYAEDTPLRKKGTRYSKPFLIRWWYSFYDTTAELHSLEHIFYDRRGAGKWRQDTIYKSTLDVIRDFTPMLNGGENDK